MSRLGKTGIEIPNGTQITVEGDILKVKGPKGELALDIAKEIEIKVENNKVIFIPRGDEPKHKKLWGTMAAKVRNMVLGVNTPYVKKLIIEGVGYKYEVRGKEIVLNVGFSHPVSIQIPDGINVVVEKSEMTITGIDKDLVGQFSAKIRDVKKPEPYKGKGIRYSDEIIRRKQGKKAVTG